MLSALLVKQRRDGNVATAETAQESPPQEDNITESGDHPWRRAAFAAMVAWVGAHIAYLAVNVFAWRVGRMPAPHLRDMFTAWYNWDTGNFVQIANSGYDSTPLDPAFFPLYPILIRFTDFVLPGSAFSAAFVVSSITCFGALMVVHRLTAFEFGRDTAGRTVYYFIAFPTAFFLSAAYNTSLFILLTIGALYCMRRGSWWTAGFVAGLASATRSSGIWLALPFIYEYLRQRDFQIRRICPNILAVGLVFTGISAFAGYCWYLLGDPLAFVHAQSHWGRTFHWPWESLEKVTNAILAVPKLHEYALTNGLDLLAFVMVFALLLLTLVGPWKFRRDQAYLVIYGFTVALFPLFVATAYGDPRPIVSMSRFVLEAIPAFMVLGAIGANRTFERIYLLPAVATQAILLAIFMHYDWVA